MTYSSDTFTSGSVQSEINEILTHGSWKKISSYVEGGYIVQEIQLRDGTKQTFRLNARSVDKYVS